MLLWAARARWSFSATPHPACLARAQAATCSDITTIIPKGSCHAGLGFLCSSFPEWLPFWAGQHSLSLLSCAQRGVLLIGMGQISYWDLDSSRSIIIPSKACNQPSSAAAGLAERQERWGPSNCRPPAQGLQRYKAQGSIGPSEEAAILDLVRMRRRKMKRQ